MEEHVAKEASNEVMRKFDGRIRKAQTLSAVQNLLLVCPTYVQWV